MSDPTTLSPRTAQNALDAARPLPRRAAGEPRLTSAVQFGMCAAVLAGAIAFGGATGGAIAALGSQPETTCCPLTQVLSAG